MEATTEEGASVDTEVEIAAVEATEEVSVGKVVVGASVETLGVEVEVGMEAVIVVSLFCYSQFPLHIFMKELNFN